MSNDDCCSKRNHGSEHMLCIILCFVSQTKGRGAERRIIDWRSFLKNKFEGHEASQHASRRQREHDIELFDIKLFSNSSGREKKKEQPSQSNSEAF
jgi:hypothetical protein